MRYDELSECAQSAYLTLGIHPHHAISRDLLAAALPAGDRPDLDAAVADLVSQSVVEEYPDGQIRVRDLVHEDIAAGVREKLSDADYQDRLRLIIHAYRRFAMRVDATLRPVQRRAAVVDDIVPFPDRAAAMREFGLARDAVVAVLRIACDAAGDTDTAWGFAEAVWFPLCKHGDVGLALQAMEWGALDAQRRDHWFAVLAYSRIAYCLRKLGRYEEAVEACHHAVALLDRISPDCDPDIVEWLLSVVEEQWGSAAEATGDLTTALTQLTRSFTIEQRRDNAAPGGSGQALALRHLDLAWLYRGQGRWVLAYRHIDAAITLLRIRVAAATGNRSDYARAVQIRGRIDVGAGRRDDARRDFSAALDILRTEGLPLELISLHEDIAENEAALGHPDHARSHLRTALDLAAVAGRGDVVGRLEAQLTALDHATDVRTADDRQGSHDSTDHEVPVRPTE